MSLRSRVAQCPALEGTPTGLLASSGQIVSLLKSLSALGMLAKGIPEEECHENGSTNEVTERGRHQVPPDRLSPPNSDISVNETNREVAHVCRRVLKPLRNERDDWEEDA